MTHQSVAQPASRTSRESRARALTAKHHHEIAASRVGFDYLVPSFTGDHAYRVHYDPAEVNSESYCECPDHEIRNNTCKHILAAALVWAGMVPAETSTRVDEGWLLEASELTGFECRTLAAAFLGLPRERRATATGVLKHAIRAGGSVEEQEERVLAWAKRNGRGMYHRAIVDAPALTFGGRTGFELEGV